MSTKLATEMTIPELVHALNDEMDRLDASDGLGESGGILASDTGNDLSPVEIADEAVSILLTHGEAINALAALRALPNGAGFEAAWDVLPDPQ